MLRCLDDNNITLILTEVHEGACNYHIGGKALAHKLLREGYYWTTLMKHNISFIEKCDQYQRHVGLHHAPTWFLWSITLPRPLYQWGMDILGSFLLALKQLMFLIVGVDYFTKWIEVGQWQKSWQKESSAYTGSGSCAGTVHSTPLFQTMEPNSLVPWVLTFSKIWACKQSLYLWYTLKPTDKPSQQTK